MDRKTLQHFCTEHKTFIEKSIGTSIKCSTSTENLQKWFDIIEKSPKTNAKKLSLEKEKKKKGQLLKEIKSKEKDTQVRKKRGRPPKMLESKEKETYIQKKRGRSIKVPESKEKDTPILNKRVRPSKVVESKEKDTPIQKKRGRPPKVVESKEKVVNKTDKKSKTLVSKKPYTKIIEKEYILPEFLSKQDIPKLTAKESIINAFMNKYDYWKVLFSEDKHFLPSRWYITQINTRRNLNAFTYDKKYYNSTPYKLKDIEIATLICSELVSSESDHGIKSSSDIIKHLEKCPHLSQCDSCTNLSYKLSKSLIRIATQRIFATPEQSILEPIVNSMDAYLPGQKIGKFGMGFFSLLYWLIGHPKRKLIIYNFTLDQNYKVIIQEKNDILTFSLQYYEGKIDVHSGLTIFIDTAGDPFTNENIDNFRIQLLKLLHVEGVSILDQYDFVINSKGYNTQDIFKINVFFGNSFIHIEDHATGITIEVLLHSLLIPSISTKGLQLSKYRGNFVDKSYSYENITNNGFRLLVGNIAVVYIPAPISMALTLPPNIRVPVSRDDIVINESDLQEIDDVRTAVINCGESLIKIGNLSYIEEAIDKYEKYTANLANVKYMREGLSFLQKKYNEVLVNPLYYESYKSLSEIFIASTKYNVLNIEKFLSNTLSKLRLDVWIGKKVYILPMQSENILSLGLPNTIIVNEKYINEHKNNWIELLASSYISEQLLPVSNTTSQQIRDQYEKMFSSYGILMSDTAKNIYYTIIAQFDALKIYFQNISIELKNFSSMIMYLYLIWAADADIMVKNSKIPNPAEEKLWIDLMLAFSSLFATFEGNLQYGGEKHSIKISPSYLYLTKGLINIGGEKVKRFSYECLLVLIGTIKEDLVTKIDIANKYLPYYLANRFSNVVNVRLIIDQVATNAIEYTILAWLFSITGTKVTNELTPHYINYAYSILKYIKSNGIDWNFIKFVYNSNFENYLVTSKLLSNYIAWVEHISGLNLAIYKEIDFKPHYTVNASQMLSYIFTHTIEQISENPNYLKTILKEMSNTKQKSQLQILDIVINEGSVKPPIDAAVTEIIQNSVDAIRGLDLDVSRSINQRDINIDIYQVKTGNKIVITIEDHVGINTWGFIHLSVPFLSTKTGKPTETGEIGSGFFNCYRGTDTVIIETHKDGQRIISVEKPLLNSSGRVFDIEKQITVEKYKGTINGTKITLIYPVQNTDIIIDTTKLNIEELTKINTSYQLVAAVDYLMDSVFSQINNKIANIIYGGKSIAIQFEDYFDTPYYTISIAKENVSTPSYILTKGIPFKRMADFVNDNVELLSIAGFGVIINLKSGYDPIQTRTRIRLGAELGSLNELIGRAIFFAIAKFYSSTNNIPISHYKSSDSVKQLKFHQQGSIEHAITCTSSQLLTYSKFDGKNSISSLINIGIEIMKDELYNNHVKEIFIAITNELTLELKENAFNIITKLVLGWLMPKNHGIVFEKRPGSLNVSEDKDQDMDYIEFQNFLNTLLEKYYKLAQTQKISGNITDTIKKIFVVKGEYKHEAAGWYNFSNKYLAISTCTWDETYITQAKEIVSQFGKNIDPLTIQESLKSNKVWQKTLSISYPAAILVHELEHARRGISGHEDYVGNLYAGDLNNNKSRSFDQTANEVYKKLIEVGLLTSLYK